MVDSSMIFKFRFTGTRTFSFSFFLDWHESDRVGGKMASVNIVDLSIVRYSFVNSAAVRQQWKNVCTLYT